MQEDNAMEAADLRSRMVSQEHKTAAIDQRLTTIEQWRAQSDIELGLDESTVTALVGAVTALLVYAVPNKANE